MPALMKARGRFTVVGMTSRKGEEAKMVHKDHGHDAR